ncbi:MAG: SAF domain-containing protein, partial [Pseudomonadota bacterium]|nr:SAF domain-containing protein [Pseudomonadota bacterium]
LLGNDHYHALDQSELEEVIHRLGSTIAATKKCTESDVLGQQTAARREARRSLVYARDLPKGHVLTSDDLLCKRPAYGLEPKKIYEIVGMSLKADVSLDGLVTMNELSDG